MSERSRTADPVPARDHRGLAGRRGATALTMLSIYVVLLVAFPSNLVVSALGAYGRPQFIWGLVLLLWWGLSRIQGPSAAVRRASQPVLIALAAFLVVVLLSFAAALLRGQPFDQVSPAVSAVARLLSWTGVALVALDGIRTMSDLLAMIRRIVVVCSLLALLGILQFATGQSLLDAFNALPGFSGSADGIGSRGLFTRSSGTATHPLEYATALSAALPLAVAVAVSRAGHRGESRRLRWWLCVATLSLASFLAVSRSALIGFALAVLLIIPALPRRYRGVVILGGTVLAAGAVLAVPGLFGTLTGMFLGVGTDPSSQSRQAGLALAPAFISPSPLIGVGLGTFLPRYFIFDDQWLGLLVEVGVLGTLAFAALFVTAVWSGATAGRGSRHADIELFGRALAASTFTVGVLFFFFDGLSFPIAAGTLFLLFGLCGAARTVGRADAAQVFTRAARRTGGPGPAAGSPPPPLAAASADAPTLPGPRPP
jgi:O-antigen ligase